MTTLFLSNHMPGNRYYTNGSSPDILDSFFQFIDARIDNISEIYLCLYLYNNKVLHDKMKSLASRDIKIHVISLPLEGYDTDYPKDIYDPTTNRVVYPAATKYSLAQEIYEDIVNLHNPNYTLYVFGHTYVRSSRMNNFARGTLPYSLHTKSIFIKLKDGNTITGLTSSNLAVRDASKDELMLLIDDTPETQAQSALFFDKLISESSLASTWVNPNPNFIYANTCVNAGTPLHNSYAAPFFTNSPLQISDRISDIISSAQSRIFVCAEHLSAFNYTDLNGNRVPGMFSAVFDKCRHGVPIRLLSQTYADASGNPHGQRTLRNKRMFIQFSREIDSLSAFDCEYAINKNVHAKFIIVDNTAIISTANYTPTEFLYGHVTIDHFDDPSLAGIQYDGIFSEVEHFIILEDTDLTTRLIDFFNQTVNHPDTYIHGVNNTHNNNTQIIGNRNNNSYHRSDCRYAPRDPNKRVEFNSIAEAQQAGYRPCNSCNP